MFKCYKDNVGEARCSNLRTQVAKRNTEDKKGIEGGASFYRKGIAH